MPLLHVCWKCRKVMTETQAGSGLHCRVVVSSYEAERIATDWRGRLVRLLDVGEALAARRTVDPVPVGACLFAFAFGLASAIVLALAPVAS